MMNISIVTIPHEAQRYDTVGDWQFDANGNLTISVSAMGDWRSEYLVARHEMDEALLCLHMGITQKQVDDFDMGWNEHDGITQPGDDPAAPYYVQHRLAMAAEYGAMPGLEMEASAHEARIEALSPSCKATVK